MRAINCTTSTRGAAHLLQHRTDRSYYVHFVFWARTAVQKAKWLLVPIAAIDMETLNVSKRRDGHYNYTEAAAKAINYPRRLPLLALEEYEQVPASALETGACCSEIDDADSNA